MQFIQIKSPILLVLLAIGMMPFEVESWSPSSQTNNQHRNKSPFDNELSSRRQLLRTALLTAATAAAVPSSANAACLQGDTRPVCIGIYKVPLDENVLPYISTPEKLHEFAPDMNYVPPIEYPKSFESAMSVLKTQRLAADDVRQQVMAGKLEDAGVRVLGLIPQVTSSCQRVFSELQISIKTKGLVASRPKPEELTDSEETVETLAIEMAENQMFDVTGCWGDCDVTIGQGIRGELGGLTVAQLTILSSLRDATRAMDDFIVTASTLKRDTGTLS